MLNSESWQTYRKKNDFNFDLLKHRCKKSSQSATVNSIQEPLKSSATLCAVPLAHRIYFRNASFNIMKCFVIGNYQRIICSYMVVYLENPKEFTGK